MKRTEYFNNTKPSEAQLNYTESSKVKSILQRFRSTAQFGVRTGFRVTVNAADATKIDVGPGEGYTGGYYKKVNYRSADNSGERISTLSDVATGDTGYQRTVTGQGLADYSENTKNYVSLVFTETSGSPLQEQYYPFDSHDTIFQETYTVSVLAESDWNNLTEDQIENRILVAIVTAKGAGVALTSADIEQVTQPKDHPTPGSQPSNITGVSINGVSQEMPIGNGTLRFEAATKKLYWTAPGDAEGTGIAITDSATINLYSNNTSYYVELRIIYDALPSSDATDTISVESLYGRTIPMASAVDQAHRDMVGSGLVTPANIHGITSEDIGGGTIDHADLYHVNGISNDADEDLLECSIVAATDSISIVNTGGLGNHFLVDGHDYELLNGYAAGTPGNLSFDVTPTPESGVYLIYVDSSGDPQYVKIAGYTPADAADMDVFWSANIHIVDIQNSSAGSGEISWDAPTQTLQYAAPGEAAGGSVHVIQDAGGFGYGYYTLYSSNTDNYVIVYVSGSLGATNSTTFDIDINETEHPVETLLKLAVVTWNATGELLDDIIDTRRFVTADNRNIFEREHDEFGRHNKIIQQRMRVAAVSAAGMFKAATDTGVFGHAMDDIGVFGSAEDDIGVQGIANGDSGGRFSVGNDVGVGGLAAADYGVYGSAGNVIGVYGTAGVDRGVVGIAPDTAGSFNAANATGLAAFAGNAVGGYFKVSDAIGWGNSAVVGHAGNSGGIFRAYDGDIGVWASASQDSAGYFTAGRHTAIHAVAQDDYAIFASAFDNYAIHATADNYAGHFTAETYGIRAIASAIGVTAVASNAGICVHGENIGGAATGQLGRVNATGVYGSATGIGGFFEGSNIGVIGEGLAAGGTGMQALAANIGIVASGGATGVWVSDGYLRYDEAPVAGAGANTQYITVIIGGNASMLKLYETA